MGRKASVLTNRSIFNTMELSPNRFTRATPPLALLQPVGPPKQMSGRGTATINMEVYNKKGKISEVRHSAKLFRLVGSNPLAGPCRPGLEIPTHSVATP